MTTPHGNIKITAYSHFHGEGINVTFARCRKGLNIRRLRGPRSRYCLDYSNTNSHVCGCDFPVTATWTDATGRWQAEDISECGPDGSPYGRGYIRFEIYDADDRRKMERQAWANQAAAILNGEYAGN